MYPSVSYLKSSRGNPDPWRWRQPNSHLGISYDVDSRLSVRNTASVSHLMFQPVFRFADFSAFLLGSFQLLLTLSLLSAAFRTGTITANNFLMAVIVYTFMFSLGLLFLRIGERVLRIDLYPDRLQIVTRFAFFFYRKTTYQRDQILEISGKTQKWWAMEGGQINPDYKITIRRSILESLQISKTFCLVCNPMQGSWIVGGLNHWKSLSIRALD